MDPIKEYEANEKKRKGEQLIAKLEQPQRLYFYMPLFLAIIIVTYPFFDGNTPFAEFLQFQLNPVAKLTTVALIIPGIKFDKDSQRLYQALCVPLENMNMAHIKELIGIRHRTAQVIFVISIVALIAVYIVMHRHRGIYSTQYACLLGCAINYLGDKKRLIRKLQEDMGIPAEQQR